MNSAESTTRSQPPLKRQNQWAMIWREFRKRKIAVFALVVIFCLITISVFAPLIANNKPLVYRGANYFAYREAIRNTLVLTNNLARKKEKQNIQVLDRQLSQIYESLQGATATQFNTIADSIRLLAITQPLEESGREQMLSLRTEIRRKFAAKKVLLKHRTVYPIIHSIHALNFIFMVAIILIIAYPTWGWAWKKYCTGHLAGWLASILIGLPVLSGISWWAVVPKSIDRSNYKSALFVADYNGSQTVDIVYRFCLWPIVPYSLDESNLEGKELEPSKFAENSDPSLPWVGAHHMGTDGIGRDVCSRMIWGGRISLSVGIVAVSIYLSIGVIVGSMAGFFRGWVDIVISRIIEIVICFPSFFLILTIVAFMGPGVFKIMVVIGITGWTGVARLVRGEFLRLSDQEFVLAGRALGYSSPRIILRHILPNAMAPVLVSATFGIAGAILTESALSFLGFGIQVPTPSWGGILSSGRDSLIRAPFLIVFPGIAIFITITAYNMVGEAFRDASDPRLRGQD